MAIEEDLKIICEDSALELKIEDREISVSIDHERILRIYPEGKTAEFLDIEDEWDELDIALKEKYPKFPRLKEVTDYLNGLDYHIIY